MHGEQEARELLARWKDWLVAGGKLTSEQEERLDRLEAGAE
jgi:hypothetical protein